MNGFITKISTTKNGHSNMSFFWKQPFDFQSSFIHRKFRGINYQIEQFSSQKFENEKLWIDTEDFLCITEGIIYNISDLCKHNKVKDAQNLIFKYYKEKKTTFFNQFEGNFAGIFQDKHTNTWTAFNNKTGTKKVFYFTNSDYVIFATDLKTLTECLKSLQISLTLNEEAAYLMLTSGFMHENLTLLNEVKQLRAGEYCSYKNGKFQVNSYFNLKDIAETKDSKKTIIKKLDDLFKDAIRLEFEIDKANNYKHLTTLSGGLDSRMTALIAYKLGYKDQVLLNFSEKGYADDIIAKQIAKAFQIELIQIELNAQSLNAIDDVVSVNSGLSLYSGFSHVFSSIKNKFTVNNGIIHTGLLGDAVMGSYIKDINNSNPRITDGMYSSKLINRIANFIKNEQINYPKDEIYTFYSRAFLCITDGCQYFDLIGETSSPFLNATFLSYAYSIPRKYKYKENIYIEWIKTLHPDIASFTWESIGGKPTNNTLLRNYYRYKRAIIKRLPINSIWKNNMNPEQLWYDKNIDVKTTLDNYYANHIDLLIDYKDLRDDLIELYKTGNITEKTQVLTLLSAFKLLFV